jgi:putative transport protein
MPAPANLTLFLAAVAIGAGRPFVETVASTGIPILLAGAAVLLTNVLIVLLVGYYLMRLPYDSLIGVVSAPPATRPFRPTGRVSCNRTGWM